ncbi:MAG: Arc family DNA-binding protein [Verrucomicrobia bacterium]|nr:Arc family DNA-binding protein [Verrucomicrobiota bacterium]
MNVTIKDLPARLHRKLKARADANKRSLNWEVIDILEKAVEPTPVDVEAILADIKKIHARTNLPPLTEEFLREAKNQGRP